MTTKIKTIAVTGCAGFVGSWICDLAIKQGIHVIGIDNLSSKVDYTNPKVEFYHADVNDNIQSYLKNADAVVHAAAYAELRHNWENKSERDRSFSSNEMATRSVLEQMPSVPIVFLSSASVYGSMSNKINSPLTEELASPETSESPYAASKLACEAYVSAWSFKRKTPFYSLRLVNQVGARSHRGVITDFYKMVKEKNHIHAADNGKQKKSWVSVEDTAEAILKLLDSSTNAPSGIYNVTSNELWSWRDIVRVMQDTSSFKVTCEDRLAGSIGDPINLHVSGEKLDKYFKCSRPIENAVRQTLSYIGWGW